VLRSLRCACSLPTAQIVTPVTRHTRCRAAEVLEVIDPARPARQSRTCGSLGVTPAAETPGLRESGAACAAAVAPDELARLPRRCAGLIRGSAAPARPTALPPAAPPSCVRGTCGGIFERWARKLAHCFGCGREPHPSPTSSREGRGRAHPPPARGRERGSPSRRISFQQPDGMRLIVL